MVSHFQGMVTVNINYRLGPYGFLHLKDREDGQAYRIVLIHWNVFNYLFILIFNIATYWTCKNFNIFAEALFTDLTGCCSLRTMWKIFNYLKNCWYQIAQFLLTSMSFSLFRKLSNFNFLLVIQQAVSRQSTRALHWFLRNMVKC